MCQLINFEVIIQKNVLLYLLVLKVVEVGEKCVIGEGLTPTASVFEKVYPKGSKTKVLAKFKSC